MPALLEFVNSAVVVSDQTLANPQVQDVALQAVTQSGLVRAGEGLGYDRFGLHGVEGFGKDLEVV